MYCYKHPENEAIGSCTSCGKPICTECAVELQDKLVCRDCLNQGKIVTTKKYDPNTVFLIELICGFFGLLGIGYFYVGRSSEGAIRLILFLVYDIISGLIIAALIAVIVGFICLPFQLVIQVGVAFWSATTLKNSILATQSD
jgi:TM2 domain-containing membrane protein YozV